MTKADLGLKLKEMYDNALDGEKVAMIHLFGIKYSAEIQESGASFQDISVGAGLSQSYGTEISKGAKLSKYVNVK